MEVRIMKCKEAELSKYAQHLCRVEAHNMLQAEQYHFSFLWQKEEELKPGVRFMVQAAVAFARELLEQAGRRALVYGCNVEIDERTRDKAGNLIEGWYSEGPWHKATLNFWARIVKESDCETFEERGLPKLPRLGADGKVSCG